jgi:hypothetical protein
MQTDCAAGRRTQRRWRITAWTTGGTGPNAQWALHGARDGLAFANATPTSDLAAWDQINDPGWLQAHFTDASEREPR